jgi:hypothetical protein
MAGCRENITFTDRTLQVAGLSSFLFILDYTEWGGEIMTP